uniref:Uncharacterized protein n=1 Tax=Acrobeloides nanus TaxID=290746 RepID=A0A914DLB9_9BILA
MGRLKIDGMPKLQLSSTPGTRKKNNNIDNRYDNYDNNSNNYDNSTNNYDNTNTTTNYDNYYYFYYELYEYYYNDFVYYDDDYSDSEGSDQKTACVCPPGTIQIFVNGDVPAAFTDNFCALASPANTCASGTGQFRCYTTTTMVNPFGYCGSGAYAFNVLNSGCASFCMCDSSGICYTPFNPGTMVRYRFAPFCNPSGVCCYTIFVENVVGATNSGLITSTGTIIDFNTQYNPPGVDLNFACSSAGPQVFDIVYVSCSGCPPTPTNPCTATG